MRNQFLAFLRQPRWGALAILIALVVLGAAPRGPVSFVEVVDASGEAAQAPTATTAPRTPWGEPDLQGTWNGQTLTPLERPLRFAGKEALTEAEAAQLIREVTSRPGRQGRLEPGEKDVAGAYNEFWLTGATKFTDLRTSLIVDPPDGRIPPLTPAAQKRLEADRAFRASLMPGKPNARGVGFPAGYNTGKLNRADGPEDRSLGARCLGGNLPDWGGSSLGAFFQIVQSPKAVTIFYDTGQGQGFNRIIPVDGSPHLPADVRLWWGDARGRWEGNTLVVDTTNFTHKTSFRGSRENLHLVERFTRADAQTLKYEVTIEDPTTWTKPWTVVTSWPRESDSEHKVFEPTCHVGNYGLIGILSGARADEKAFAEGRAPDPATKDIYSGGGDVGQPNSATLEIE